jgi:excisionase family DNA binding protein
MEALAYLADVDIATISRIERGLIEPRRETVVRLAKGLGIRVNRMAEIIKASSGVSMIAVLLLLVLAGVVNDDPLWTVRDLAEYLKKPVQTVYQWNKTGTGPRRIHVGQSVRYRRSDVEAWLESRRPGETS